MPVVSEKLQQEVQKTYQSAASTLTWHVLTQADPNW